MITALNFDGVNDYLTFPVWTAPNDFRLVLPADISGGGGRIWFYDSANYASHNMDISRASNNELIVDIGGEKAQWGGFYVADTDIHEITIERVNGFISVYIDGVQFGSSLPSTNTLTLNTYGKGDWGGYASAMELEGFEFTDLTTPSNSRLYSASASNSSDVPVKLKDTIGGYDATGFGMPTDGSAWVGSSSGSTVVDVVYAESTTESFSDPLLIDLVVNVLASESASTTLSEPMVLDTYTYQIIMEESVTTSGSEESGLLVTYTITIEVSESASFIENPIVAVLVKPNTDVTYAESVVEAFSQDVLAQLSYALTYQESTSESFSEPVTVSFTVDLEYNESVVESYSNGVHLFSGSIPTFTRSGLTALNLTTQFKTKNLTTHYEVTLND